MICLVASCWNESEDSPYPRQVGDIAFDAALDDPEFMVCNEKRAQQYYAFRTSAFQGEKPAVEQYFEERFQGIETDGEDGYITVRFIINCEGKAGRFRLQEMGMDYKEKQFEHSIGPQLLELTKKFDGWNSIVHKGQPYDYYQYLTFKIQGGKITEILP